MSVCNSILSLSVVAYSERAHADVVAGTAPVPEGTAVAMSPSVWNSPHITASSFDFGMSAALRSYDARAHKETQMCAFIRFRHFR